MRIPLSEIYVTLSMLWKLIEGVLETPECNDGKDENWKVLTPQEVEASPICTTSEECGGNPENHCVNGTCVCYLTYGYAVDQNTGTCSTQIDECQCEIAACEHTCTDLTPTSDNEYTRYQCSCDPGYELYNVHFCQDIDECAEEDFCGGGAPCTNSIGGFSCSCPSGWTLDADTGLCADIDECEDNNGDCEQTCDNSDGGYSCRCNTGYTLEPSDSQTCNDIDECQDEVTACGTQVDQCQNNDGSYTCTCQTGYAPGESGPACEDVDECLTIDCGHGGTCENTEGSFTCSCPAGFENDPENGLCIDTDECLASQCGEDAIVTDCQNTPVGSYTCTCAGGYSGGEADPCTDDDECTDDPNICDFGTCSNQAGTFSCACDAGYETSGDGQPCTQIDECARDANTCGSNSVSCEDRSPGFQCTCEDGYEAAFFQQCSDIDECETEGICGDASIATCENLPGSYTCRCSSSGYTGGERTACTNVNECSVSNYCEHGGTCTDTEGSFRCDCDMPTWKGGDGEKCTDNDECDTNPELCGSEEAHTTCVNTQGGFQCNCADGYENHAETSECINIDECSRDTLANVCGASATSCTDQVGSFQCACSDGYQATAPGDTCTDVDECEGFTCNDGGTCSNTAGSFSCECFSGFQNTQDGSCGDVDECADAETECGQHDSCQNSEGSFVCDCGSTGFWPGPGSQCLYRQLLVEVRVQEPWSVDLMDTNSDSYKYLETQIPAQFEEAVSNSDSLASNLVSAQMAGVSQHLFMAYLTLDFTHVPTTMTDDQILTQISSGYAASDASSKVISLDMSTLAIQGQSEGDGEQGPQIELQCRGDSMEVTVDATSVEAGVTLSLMDPTCAFEQNEDGNYVYSTDYTLCDTKKNTNDGIITYIQYVLVNAELQLIGPDDTRVVTHDSILAGLNCIYSTSSVTMTSLVVGDGPVAVEEAGSFSVELDMYTDESFSTKHTSFPVEVDYLDDVYIGASLDSPDSSLRLNLDSCWLTNSPNAYNPLRLYIMEDYCPSDPDFEYMSTLRTNVFVPFRYDAQMIISNGELNRDVYYMCQYTLCDLSDDSSTCQDETNSCTEKRKRRSAEDKSLYLGMVTLNILYHKDATPRPMEQNQDQQVEQEQTNAEDDSLIQVVAISSVATLVFSMALFATAFLLLRRFGKFSPN